MAPFKIILFKTAGPLIRLVVILTVRLAGYERYRLGKCSFFGPSEFIRHAQIAAERLRIEDAAIWRGLSANSILFWYHLNAVSENCFSNTFTIPERYLHWGAEGFISRLVSCYFLTKHLGNPPSRK